ncbi:MAG TPA: UDP-glucose/GDP-mannose dehydrogenase family protein [Planctomycetota bacterium]|jgi:UDPglucose 6-dehydrogenase|nr:UDP-glucose/GDP-mannose dehydrogenase family protein [Planctomycetota bacterium]
MRICVIGTGYVGLVAGTCFADSGNDVLCVDIDAEKIARLNRGEIPIYEPGLEDLVRRNVAEGRLRFSTDVAQGVRDSLVVFVAVGTPPGGDGSADLSSVLAVAETIGKAANGRKIVVDKSTVPVGTAERVAEVIRRHTNHPVAVVSNPEFLKEGAAVEDFLKPDRVVIGTDDPEAAEAMKELYAPFVRRNQPILLMDVRSAELTKYAANAMLATRISFMNEVANLCERLGADVNRVREGVGTDARIGFSFLYPGVGYGGSCFPKDVKALEKTALASGYAFRILRAVEEVNEAQKRVLVAKVKAHFGEDLRGRSFAVWGLAFKPNTDDMREAPSIAVLGELLAAGAQVRASDPEAIPTARRIFGDGVSYFEKPYDALPGADALLLVTEWNEYRHPDFDRMRSLLRQPIIFDGRNVYPPKTLRDHGFTYYGIGVGGSA